MHLIILEENRGVDRHSRLNRQCFQNLADSGEQKCIKLGSQVPSTYSDMCEIQREAKKSKKKAI